MPANGLRFFYLSAGPEEMQVFKKKQRDAMQTTGFSFSLVRNEAGPFFEQRTVRSNWALNQRISKLLVEVNCTPKLWCQSIQRRGACDRYLLSIGAQEFYGLACPCDIIIQQHASMAKNWKSDKSYGIRCFMM
jgi:hypothetical protein